MEVCHLIPIFTRPWGVSRIWFGNRFCLKISVTLAPQCRAKLRFPAHLFPRGEIFRVLLYVLMALLKELYFLIGQNVVIVRGLGRANALTCRHAQ